MISKYKQGFEACALQIASHVINNDIEVAVDMLAGNDMYSRHALQTRVHEMVLEIQKRRTTGDTNDRP